MKKSFALVLVLVTVFTLAACGESSASADKTTNPAPTNPAPTNTPTTNPGPADPIITFPPETTAPQTEELVGVLSKEEEMQFCILVECEMSDRFAKHYNEYYSDYVTYVNALGNLALVDLREEKTDLSVTITPAVEEEDGQEVLGYNVKIFAGDVFIRNFFWDAVRGYVVIIYDDSARPECNADPETNLVDEYIKKEG